MFLLAAQRPRSTACGHDLVDPDKYTGTTPPVVAMWADQGPCETWVTVVKNT